jgi:hypothetical protein
MDQFSRRIVGFGVNAGDVDGIALCCMFNSAFSNKGLPKRLSSDNDPLFRYRRWQANLRILEIEEIKSIPYSVRHESRFNKLFLNSRNHPYHRMNLRASIKSCPDNVTRRVSTLGERIVRGAFFWQPQAGRVLDS